MHLTSFAPLAPRFDGFIVDLWGVVHDGVQPYPGAADTLARLRDLGKPVVLLSNAPRRAHIAQVTLRNMGIPDELYSGIVTSGEATHRALEERSDAWFARLGHKVFFLGPDRDHNIIEDVSLTQVDAPDQADFVVVAGPDDLDGPSDIADHDPILRACHAAGLPMICANPDLEIVRDGVRIICAGTLAEHYASLGGDVKWMGKPDAAIYAPVLAMLGVPAGRVVGVGDALRTDIAGAAAAGLASCWVLGGIHSEEVGEDRVRAEAAARAAGLSPDFFVPSFDW